MEFWICFFVVVLLIQSMNRKADIKKLQRQIQWLAQKNNLNLEEALEDNLPEVLPETAAEKEAETQDKPETDAARTAETFEAGEYATPPAAEFLPEETNADGSGIAFLGQKLITWIAGFAAVLGFFCFARYSIENGLLGPRARLLLTAAGGLFGIGFGCWLHQKPGVANGRRIGEALSGSGAAALYFAAYALSKIYALAPASVSFALMCLITAGTILLTLRCGGQATAFLALVGGFLTPALTAGSTGNIAAFSGYLFVLAAALIFMSSRVGSVLLGFLTLSGLYFWVAVWMMRGLASGNSIWLFVLTAAVSVLTTVLFNGSRSGGAGFLQKVSQLFCALFAFAFLCETDFGLQEWGVLAVLLSGMTVLAALRAKEYIAFLAAAEAAVFLLLTTWHPCDAAQKRLMFALFAAIALLPFYLLSWHKKYGGFVFYVMIAAPLVYALAYYQFPEIALLPYGGLAAAAVMALPLCRIDCASERESSRAGGLVLSSASLLTMSFAALTDAEFWPVVLAVEILIMGAVMTFAKLQNLAAGVTICILLFLYTQAFVLEDALLLLVGGDEVAQRLFHASRLNLCFYVARIIVPVLAFGALAFVSKERWIKAAAGALAGILGFWGLFSLYMLIQMKMSGAVSIRVDGWDQTLITNVLLFVGGGYLFSRKALPYKIVLAVGLWRLFVCGLLQNPPLMDNGYDRSSGYVLYAFGVPFLLFCFFARKEKSRLASDLFSWAAAAFSFLLTTLLLRNALEGAFAFSDNRIFAYSAVWLLLGCVWLACAFKNRALVKPAFGLVYVVIAKVFLYDVSSLDDVWRIAALFGLAGSLLGISYCYSRWFQKTDRIK